MRAQVVLVWALFCSAVPTFATPTVALAQRASEPTIERALKWIQDRKGQMTREAMLGDAIRRFEIIVVEFKGCAVRVTEAYYERGLWESHITISFDVTNLDSERVNTISSGSTLPGVGVLKTPVVVLPATRSQPAFDFRFDGTSVDKDTLRSDWMHGAPTAEMAQRFVNAWKAAIRLCQAEAESEPF